MRVTAGAGATMGMLVGWGLVLLGGLLFLTRFPRTSWQPHVVSATFAGFAPLPVFLGLIVLSFAGGAWLPATALLVVMLFTQGIARLQPRPDGRPLLTILTANMWFGRGDAAAIVALAREHDVDVVALQEVTEELADALDEAGLTALLPHRVVAPGPLWEGAGLWSRHELRDTSITRRGTLNRTSAVVAVSGSPRDDDPRVDSVHVHAPWPGPPGPWVEQLAEIEEEFATASRPLVVAGDFNASYGHASFRRILRHSVDAAMSARAWTARTWPQHLTSPAVICIDHVLLGGLIATRASTHAIPGADHRAIVAMIATPRTHSPGR